MDGKVLSADVKYKIPGESTFRVTTRPIHKLVLIVPVEEQTMEEPADPGEIGAPVTEEKSTREHVDQIQTGETEELEPRRPALQGMQELHGDTHSNA
jgi:hypothetical protein